LLKRLVTLDNLVDPDIFKTGKKMLCLYAIILIDDVGHCVAIFLTQRLAPQFGGFDYMRIASNNRF